MKNIFKIILLIAIISNSSCKKDAAKVPDITNSQEQITTVYFKVIDNLNQTNTTIFKWKDIDGSGGNAPSIDTILLKNSNNYQVELLVLDESKSPVDTISNEIKNEADVHRFFFYPSDEVKSSINTTYLDADSKGRPLGLVFKLDVNSASSNLPLLGKLNVVLSHYDGVEKDNNPSSESDLDIQIPIKIYR
jgi:hypothetical protein